MFDLDNTLIAGDSDYSWGEFLTTKKLVDPVHFKRKNDQFYSDYQKGNLDILAYLEFSLAPLVNLTRSDLDGLHKEFMENVIHPMWLPKAEEPICKKLGIKHLIATELEESNKKFTGKVSGIPSFGEGKVSRLVDWLDTSDFSLENSTFYSDSINDLPLLQLVDFPVAVDPCPKLRKVAISLGWKIISLRN